MQSYSSKNCGGKRPRTRFQDIIYNVEAIRRYTKGLSKKTFLTNDLVVDAVERCLSRISEAARKLGKQAETLAPNQPWKKIRGRPVGDREAGPFLAAGRLREGVRRD